MNIYKDYINKHGNFSHILNVNVNESLNDIEKNEIINIIFDILNEKNIEKNLNDNIIIIKWRVSDETNLLQYFTDGCGGILNDRAINEHTKLVINDIEKKIDKNKFNITITKPITKSICIM